MSHNRITGPLATASRALLILLFLFGIQLSAWAEAPGVAVLYPDIREPYRGVFLRIISGIEEGLKTSVRQLPLAAGGDLDELERRLKSERTQVVIALGRGGLKVAEQLREKWPVVVGAVLFSATPDTTGLTGISLTPDPEVLFDWLRTLSPEVKRITVIYNRGNGDGRIGEAQEAAKRHGLILNALPAENIREAATLYRSFLQRLSENSEALWLPQDDSVLDETALLPVILKEAWDKNLVVFSSTPDHVKKGALFSLYPDNVGMGRRLATMALEQLQARRPKVSNIQPLRDLLIAVNLRTAEHLGLQFARHDRRKFDLVFPSP